MLDLPNTSHVEGHEIRWGSIWDGPPPIALHGTSFSAQVWRRIIPHMADRRRVYFYDMPGYGQSEMRDGQDVSFGMQNRVLAELLQLWGAKNRMSLPMTSAGQRPFDFTISTRSTSPR